MSLPLTSNEWFPTSLWQQRLFTGTWQAGNGPPASVVEPASGETLGEIGVADPKQVASSAKAAAKAQSEWYALPYEERAALMRRVAQLAESNLGSIVDWLVRESGSTRLKATAEVSSVVKSLYESAALPSQSQGEVLPSRSGRLSLARRRPLGVVGVISPFNFPLYLAMRAVAPALATGNAVVLKPDPRTAVSGGLLIARLFELAGLPAGVLHVLPGGADVGSALTSDPHVAMIQFTGSTVAGRKVGEAAGKYLKKVSLELGGKNSLIILDDADLDLALSNATWGCYLHQGQICMSTGRVLVHCSIYDRFVEMLVGKAASLSVGDPFTTSAHLGPLINAQQRDHVAHVIDAAVQAGAHLAVGGNYNGLLYEATVLSNVGRDNPAFHEEIFGPVAVVVPFDNDAEAVELANDNEYGLSAAVLSQDVSRALKLGEQLRVGLLHINDQTVNDDVINPFGGVGVSGNGSSIGGPANWDEFTQWQWLTVNGQAPIYPL